MVPSRTDPPAPDILRSDMPPIPGFQQRIFAALSRRGAVAVLGVLLANPDHEYTAREVAAAADVPTMSCSRILHGFHDLRIVRRRRVGRAYALSLDENSQATRFIRELTRLSKYE